MIKHRTLLSKLGKRRPFSSCPSPLQHQAPQISSSASHRNLCFSLAEQLIKRGLFSSAQKVVQRLISQCTSIGEAISAADFAFSKGMELDIAGYGCLIRKLVISGDALTAEAVYMNCIIGKGLQPDCNLLNSMIICYCKLGKLGEAKFCFDRLIKLNFIPWVGACNAIIKAFCRQERIMEAYDCFCGISKASGIVLDYACYNRLVDGLCCRGFLDEGLHVFCVMVGKRVLPTIHVCKSLIIGCCKWGRVEEAEILCTEIESYGFVFDNKVYTNLLNSYCKGRKMKTAMRLFMRLMKMGHDLDNYTYNTLIHGFVNLGLFSKAWAVHSMMVNSGLKPDLVTYQIMLSKYCKDQKVDCAVMLFNDMLHHGISPNVHCYTALLAALCKEQRFEEVNSLYHRMMHNGVVPDGVLFFTLAKNHFEGDELCFALTFLQAIAREFSNFEISVDAYSVSPKSLKDAITEIEYLLEELVRSNTDLAQMGFSIYMIALCMGGTVNAALQCMEKMAIHGILPLPTAYNALIKLLIQEGLAKDVEYVVEVMQDRGLVPNPLTFLLIVNELCKQGDFLSAIDVLGQIEEMRCKPHIAVYNSIICCLGRHRMICEAEKIFNRMLEFGIHPDETIFVTMINAYSKNGWANKAEELFEKMMAYDLWPGSRAYTALIPGLVKKNMTEKSCLYLDRMLNDGFVPNIVLYTSLIKQFLRKRDLGFALRLVDLIEKSGVELDLVAYITLVSGVCRNVRPFNGRWYVSSAKLSLEKEMLFHLLHQKIFSSNKKSLEIMISSLEEMKFFALKLIQTIKRVSAVPNLYLYNGMMSGFCWAQSMQEAYEHLNLMQSEGVHPNQVTFTILIDGHIQHEEVDLAVALFNKMCAHGLTPDSMAFNTLIRGFCKVGRLLEAISLAQMMQKRGLLPSKSSYEAFLSSLCGYHSSVYALKLCEDMLSHNYLPCRYNICWLLSILCKDNKLYEARILVDRILQRKKKSRKMLGPTP